MIINPYVFAGAPGGGSLDATILALSPWGYWKLDETGTLTTAADSSGNGRNGTYAGTGIAGGATGLFGGSQRAVTQGGTSRIDLPTLGAVNGQKLSIVQCFKTAAAGLQHLVSADSSGTGERVWQWRLNAGNMEFIWFAAVGSVATTGLSLNNNSPHMACLVLDPTLAAADGQAKLYADGALVAATTAAATITATSVTRPAIGARASGMTSEPFVGTDDNCAIFLGKALSAAEVLAIWNARNAA